MRHKLYKLSAIFYFGLQLTGLQAQESVNTSGGNASGIIGSVSYTVGQVVYTSNSEAKGSVAQGVQQAFEISEVTAIQEAIGINLSVLAYPNPTTDFLRLEVKDFELSTIQVQLFDTNGKLLQTIKLTGTESQIDMNTYVPSTYFVRVTSNNKLVKEFKIIKAQ